MWNKIIDNRKEGKGDFVATMSIVLFWQNVLYKNKYTSKEFSWYLTSLNLYLCSCYDYIIISLNWSCKSRRTARKHLSALPQPGRCAEISASEREPGHRNPEYPQNCTIPAWCCNYNYCLSHSLSSFRRIWACNCNIYSVELYSKLM